MYNVIDKYFPKGNRYFKVLNRDEGYDSFEEINKTIEAIDHEDAAEKYAERYYENNCGDWEEDSEITLEVVQIFKDRPDDRRDEFPKKFEVSYSYYPSFNTLEIEDDEFYEERGDE